MPTSAPSKPLADGDRGTTRAERSTLTAELLSRAHGLDDETNRRLCLDEVVLLNRGVAEAVASRYFDRGIARDDLVQVAYEGLVRAVRRYDPTTRNDLLTFAVPTIRGQILRHFRDQGWTVRPPRRLQELQWRVNKVIGELEQQLGREPREREVLVELDITAEEYAEAVTAFGCFQPTSLDQPIGEAGDASLGDVVPAEDSGLEASEARVVLAPVVRHLCERDRRILELRFFEDRTQSQIGVELGVTQTQVSRLLQGVLSQLRTALLDADVDGTWTAPTRHRAVTVSAGGPAATERRVA